MPKITSITPQKSNADRVSVFIDGQFCTGIRSRTFMAMDLTIGSEITCEKLKEKENFFWKQGYGPDSWKKEKVRINRIKELIERVDDRLKVQVVGFGADSTEIIKQHPDEKGVPDLNVILSGTNKVVMKLEVTGTEFMRGTDYWVRPDKIEYAENHPDEEVWTALHYSNPIEIVRFLKHDQGKKYIRETKNIRGANEIYCTFQDSDEEILTLEEFTKELKNILE